jgi:alpha-mannosidase
MRIIALMAVLAFGKLSGEQQAAAEGREEIIWIVPNSHIDVAWLWRYDPETIHECCNLTFSRAIENLERFPDFTFSQSQVPLYEPMKTFYPEIYARIKKYVKERRWEIVGGHYLEFEGAEPCGESLVRQCLYGKRYFRREFGVDVKTGWQPDSWTHPWTLPQILNKSGIGLYMFKRCEKGERFFWWESPDGSRVLAYKPEITKSGAVERMEGFMKYMKGRYGMRMSMTAVGGGDHGGGVDGNRIESIEREAKDKGLNIRFGRFDEFMSALAEDARRAPLLNDELGFEYEGSYTTCGEIKNGNRRSECLLMTAEKFCSAALSLNGSPYPQEKLANAWQKVLFNQFHDIISGCVIPPAAEDAIGLYEQVAETGQRCLRKSLEAISSQVTMPDTNSIAVFNPLSWERMGVLETDVETPLPADEVCLIDPSGKKTILTQATSVASNTGGAARVHIVSAVEGIPSVGYKVFVLTRSGGAPVSRSVSATENGLENAFFRVSVDSSTGDISGIYDKRLGREILKEGESGNVIQVLEDEGDSEGMINLTGKSWKLGQPTWIKVIENGPARATLEVRNKIWDWKCAFVRQISLYPHIPRIDFKLRIEWNSDHKMIKVAFPLNLTAEKASYDIAYGVIERKSEGEERPAQKWVDVSDGSWGVSLLNDNRYGYDVKDNVVRLSVLRSPTEPAHNDDCGTHAVGYSVYPHPGGWREAGTKRRGYEFNYPLVAVKGEAHGGRLPPEGSFFEVTPENVILSAVKKAEESDGLILRLYETEGRASQARISFMFPPKSAVETNLLEEGQGDLTVQNGSLVLPIGAHEIKTVRVR